MLEFKPITINDKPEIDPYLKKNSQTCDRTFANLFCWQHHYRTQWAEFNGWLVIRACINGERRLAYIPLALNDSPDYTVILPALAEDAQKHDQTLTLMGLSDSECEMIENVCGKCFIFDKNRDFADYVYLSENLSTLKGRKYAQKRNHVNKFKSLYPYRYEPITESNKHLCLALEETWSKNHNDDGSAEAESMAIRKALDNFEELGLDGGALFVDDEIVAFTYGSELNEHTFCTHVEKANIEYDGVYQMINYLFAQHLSERYKFINREEDLGIAGLRKSKLSYEPEHLEYKTTALLLNDDMHDIMNVWHRCFGEDDNTVQQFLSRYYFNHCSFLERADGRIVAMLFVIPCQTNFGKAAYLYGIATDPEYRNRGFSTKLMNQFLERCKKEDFRFAFLIPEDKSLTNFYSRFGYRETSTRVEFKSDLNLGTGIAENDTALILPLNDDCTGAFEGDSIVCTPML